jgi:DNA repair protein RadD
VIQKEWLSPLHPNFQRFWSMHGGNRPFPKSAEDFLERADELKVTAEIQLKPDGKYQKVCGWRAGLQLASDSVPTDAAPTVAANDNWKPLMAAGESWDDDIPF